MPKWTDYTIKTTVADNDEIMTLDTAGKANKRLSLSTLSDWVLGKIADKVFEKLQTNDKTILGAINELNSNKLNKKVIAVISEDFGKAIEESGIIPYNRVAFFICSKPINSPLGSGFIILAHHSSLWINHPIYIIASGNNIRCGTINCENYSNITKDS